MLGDSGRGGGGSVFALHNKRWLQQRAASLDGPSIASHGVHENILSFLEADGKGRKMLEAQNW